MAFLERNTEIKHISLCLDNDAPKGFIDFNDDLVHAIKMDRETKGIVVHRDSVPTL